ncbi:MAG TPA: glycosyltransferase [Stellaceae bacterium]|nr:glycosyltransferase [Stellaceae bacterium]
MTSLAEHEARTAVSLTPLALEADSRTFRIAQSLAEAGYRSIVVEGKPSARHFWDGAIEVRSLGNSAGSNSAGSNSAGPPPSRSGRARRVIGALRDGRAGAPGEWLLYGGFRGDYWWRYGYRARRQLPSAALYYLHSFEFYETVAPVATRLGARIVYDAHDFYRGIEPDAKQRPFDRKRLRPLFNRLEDRAIAGADAVVTVSDGVAGLIEQACGRRPVVVRNCHDERQDRTPPADLRTALGLAHDDCLCVVVGNCKAGMAVEAAIAALAELPPHFHLAFLGRGYEAVAAAPHPASVTARLHFGHVVAPSEIVPAIRSADVGLVLYEPYSENYRYALPNGFFQVVAAGLPLVRAYLPEIEAAIGRRVVGECLPRLNPSELAQAILRCAAHAAALRPTVAALADTLRWETETRCLRHLIDGLYGRA